MSDVRSTPVDGFALAYDDVGTGQAVVQLHGWPGDRSDYRALTPLLTDTARVVTPDLRGFGRSDKHDVDPAGNYDAAAQARSVVGLVEELGLVDVVLVGYDVGSVVAQAIARTRPDLVRAMVLAPPMPGAGRRVLEPDISPEFWYQHFHQLALVEQLVDGRPDAVRAYVRYFWEHWSGPDHHIDEDAFTALLEQYSAPGAFRASIAWYRSGGGTIARSAREKTPDPARRTTAPVTVLWPEHDPLFPRAWSDTLDDWFTDARLREVDGVGHFAPLEYPQVIAEAVRERLTTPADL